MTTKLHDGDPAELGPYRLLSRLGEGGMGSVYLAEHPDRGLVALKVIRRDLAADPSFRRRFRSEVTRAQQVPAFCTAEVLDADPDHEPPYLVVEYVEGPSLSKVVQERGPLNQANLHGLAIGVATALTAIHEAGVIHRDLKPANVLLSLSGPKVIDFGIARAAAGPGTDTSPGQVVGTIPYMAPERLDTASRGQLTAAADVFAWGAVIAYAGTGVPPFGAGTVEAMARILTQPPDLGPLTGTLRDLVEQALAKDPEQRPSARELLNRLVSGDTRRSDEGLVAAASRQAVVAVADAHPTTRFHDVAALPPPAGRKRRLVVPALLTIALVVGGVAIGLLKPWQSVAEQPMSLPSPSPSSIPSPSPSAKAETLRVRDSLAAPGPFWKDDTRDAKAKCIVAGVLTVTRTTPSTYRCPGYFDPLTDLRASVDVALHTEEACAALWFRFDGTKGYLLSVCRDRYVLYTHDGSKLGLIRTGAISPLSLGTYVRAEVEVVATMVRVVHNGQELFRQPDQMMSRGRVVLGIAVPARAAGPGPYEVTFKNVEIWDLS